MTERRRSRRRRIPFLRGAVLRVGERDHIVTVLDLSPQGAFLATRSKIASGLPMRLRMIPPRDGREVVIPVESLRRSDGVGLAVRFKGLDAHAARRVEEFALEGFLPSPQPVPPDHFEYQVLERSGPDAGELNRLGLDGWQLSVALPKPGGGVRMVFVRRL